MNKIGKCYIQKKKNTTNQSHYEYRNKIPTS